MLFHKDTCPIRNLIPLGPFGHIMPTSPYRLSSGSRNEYSLSSSFLRGTKEPVWWNSLFPHVKQGVPPGKTSCFWWWNQLFHTLEHPVKHIGYLHEIVRRENCFIRFYVTEKGDTFFICHSIHHRFNTLYNKALKSHMTVWQIFFKKHTVRKQSLYYRTHCYLMPFIIIFFRQCCRSF